ncbi:hypothetical protein M422DRAFT_247537 [Sphaerobolus stellatus SS14]|nr:hypothetical protein M422DRAFT_247537 [Sphaerobolus stellatus SS14]
MGAPSRPNGLPRDLAVTLPYRPQSRLLRSYQPLAVALRLHRPRSPHPRSSTGHHIANPKRYVTPPPFGRQFDESPPSASSLLNHCLDKGKASAPARAPFRFMTLDSPSSSVREGATAGPSHSTSSIKKTSSSQPKVEEDDVDVLVFCPKCQRYPVFEHYYMFPRYLSPEL